MLKFTSRPLYLGETVPTKHKTRWVLQTIWSFWNRQQSLVSGNIQTEKRSVRNLVYFTYRLRQRSSPSRCDSITYSHNKFVYLHLTTQIMLYNYWICFHTSISNIGTTASFGIRLDQHSSSFLYLSAARNWELNKLNISYELNSLNRVV